MIKSLATSKSKIVQNFMEYIFLLYGREGIGKSTLFSQFPNAYFILTEPGAKGLEIFKSDVTGWRDVRKVIDLLLQTKQFQYVVIDTADIAYEMALDYVCEEFGIEYPGESASGKEDYGKSWKAVKKEFMFQIHRLIRSGRGVAFTSHAVDQEIKTKGGEKYSRIGPSMGKQARTAIEALVDYAFYADYARTIEGHVTRIMITQGDDSIFAKQRKGMGKFPTIMPLQEEGAYEAMQQGFRGEHPGVDPAMILSHKLTQKTATAFLRKVRAASPSPPTQRKAVKRTAVKRTAVRRRK